jgi:hypothetical protein
MSEAGIKRLGANRYVGWDEQSASADDVIDGQTHGKRTDVLLRASANAARAAAQSRERGRLTIIAIGNVSRAACELHFRV